MLSARWTPNSPHVSTYSLKEVRRELDRVKGRRRDDQLQIRSLLHGLLHEPEENVGVDRPFVCLVQHDDGVLLEIGVDETLSQEHTVCHVLDDRLRAGHILETDGVADLVLW